MNFSRAFDWHLFRVNRSICWKVMTFSKNRKNFPDKTKKSQRDIMKKKFSYYHQHKKIGNFHLLPHHHLSVWISWFLRRGGSGWGSFLRFLQQSSFHFGNDLLKSGMAMINPRSDRRQSKKVKLKSNKSTAELRATWSKSQKQKRELEGKIIKRTDCRTKRT